MKTSSVLLLCVWAAHALALRAQSFESSSAAVHLRTVRSSRAPRQLEVEAFNQHYSLRLQPATAPFAEGFKMQTTSRDEQGPLIIEDIGDYKVDDSDLYEAPEAGSVVRLTAAGVEGFISPSLVLNTAADGRHEAVRKNYEAEPESFDRDYLQVPEEARSHYQLAATSRATRQAVTSATVEMLIVVDSTLAAKLGSDLQVMRYLGVFWNAVNQRYATMADPRIKLVLTGAVIARNSSDEPFISENTLTQNYIHSKNTLNSLSRWAFKWRDHLTPHDMLYLMTGKNMFSMNDDNVMQNNTSGRAFMSGACSVSQYYSKSYNVVMGEDFPLYTGVMTAAHEVAHNLGAPHDGEEGAASCLGSEGFIMSKMKHGEKNNLFFSLCSKRLMKQYISGSAAACLHTNTSTKRIALSSTLPGQVMSLDQQCQAATGQSGAYASRSVTEDSLCIHLICEWKTQQGQTTTTTTSYRRIPAAEGSPCRSGGACKNGSCQ
uniref:Peptidase M12B domain-containing protein n=1 Tax=Scylla olivacea TaxID=85551 RepID=A0A0P4VYJ3_SCYOL